VALHTIGFTQKSLRQFVALLQSAGVDAVIASRLRNTGQLAGYAKKDDLAYVLELMGIAYGHHPELVPSHEILDTYRKDKDWDRYVRHFRPLIADRAIETVAANVLGRYRNPCLLCSEATPDQCHRRLVAEYWQKHTPGLDIVHL